MTKARHENKIDYESDVATANARKNASLTTEIRPVTLMHFTRITWISAL